MILPWPRRFPLPCHELARLLSVADWLQAAANDEGVDSGGVPESANPARSMDAAEPSEALAASRRLERGQVVQPLVRSHAVLVHTVDVAGLSWSFDGTVRLWNAARSH